MSGFGRMVSARALVGRTIVAFAPGPFDSGVEGDRVAHNPTIYLDDGSALVFLTEETEVGEYGTFIQRIRRAMCPATAPESGKRCASCGRVLPMSGPRKAIPR